MNLNKIVSEVNKLKKTKIKNTKIKMPKRGAGKILHLYKHPNVSHKPWAKNFLKFLWGHIELQPSTILTGLKHTLSHLATQVARHEDIKHFHHHVREHHKYVHNMISEIKHIKEKISHVKKRNVNTQSGSGFKLKSIFKAIDNFLKGKGKVKPSQILDGVADVANVCAIVTRALKVDTATVVFDRVAKTSKEVSKFFKQKGAGRYMEGHGKKSGSTCDKKNPAKGICCGGKKKKGGSLSAGGALKAGGSLSAGGSKHKKTTKQKGGRAKARALATKYAGDTYDKCINSMRRSNHRITYNTKDDCARAVNDYGKYAANFTGSKVEMREAACKRKRGLE